MRFPFTLLFVVSKSIKRILKIYLFFINQKNDFFFNKDQSFSFSVFHTNFLSLFYLKSGLKNTTLFYPLHPWKLFILIFYIWLTNKKYSMGFLPVFFISSEPIKIQNSTDCWEEIFDKSKKLLLIFPKKKTEKNIKKNLWKSNFSNSNLYTFLNFLKNHQKKYFQKKILVYLSVSHDIVLFSVSRYTNRMDEKWK